jgi:hypothetical protein
VADRFGGSGLHGALDVEERVAVTPGRLEPAQPPLASATALAIDPPPLAVNAGLPPRVQVPTAGGDLEDAPPEKLLAALWRRYGGDTPLDQAKSILAMIGAVAIAVVFIRFGSKKEPEHHEE